MNKVFKVVYSKSKGCYVVVPETAKNNNGKKKVLASVLAGLAVAGAMGGVAPQEAMANADYNNSHVNIWANTQPGFNGENYNVGQNSIVVGYQNTTDNVGGHDGKVAIGAKNTSTNNATTAVGNRNTATGGAATAVGAGNTASGNGSVAVGNVNNADAKAAVAIGTYNNVNYTKGSWETTPKKAGEYSTVVGNYSSATGTSASAMGVYTNATGAGSFAAGYNNNAKGQNSVAIGSENTSHVADTVTLGQFNNAKTMGGISIGKNNLTDSADGNRGDVERNKENSQIAIGRDNTATNLDAIAIGRDTHATGSGATALGARADASGNNSIAIGQSGKTSDRVVASGVNSIAIGMQSQAAGEAGIAEGAGARAGGKYGVALGRTTKANAEAATALGSAAEANIANGVALGSSSITTTDKGVLGYNPSDLHNRKYTNLQGNVQKATTAAVSIGNGSTLTRQLTGLAAGTADTDAVNVAQLKNVGVAVTGNTGSSDFLTDGGKLNVRGEGRVSVAASDDGAKDSKLTLKFDDTNLVKAGRNVTVDTSVKDGKTTYTINAADTAAKYDFLTNATANGGKLDGEATPTKVQSGTTVNYAAGKNLTVKQDIETSLGQQTYTYSLNKDLKEITSITNNGGPTMHFGGDNISITGGNLDLGDNNITNLKSGGDVVNNAANIGDVTRISKANDLHVAPTAGTNNNVAEYTVDANKKVTLTYQDGNGKTVNGPKAVIDLSGLKTGDMSSFNVKSTATEGKVAQGSAGVQEIRDGKTVEMQAGKNMTIKQTNKNGNAAVEFALNKDIDLTPDGSIKIGDTNITDNGLTINNGPSITKTGINAGDLKITNVKAGVNDNDAVNVSQLKQVRADERHIKPGEYAVDNNGKVTMTYLDGNNKDVPNETAVITGIAKQDLSNINKGGETVIQNLAKKSIDMENGKNTKVSNREINGVKTFKVDVEGDLTDITSITNKGGDGKVVFGGNQTVNVAGNHNINLNAKVGDITGLTNVTLDAPDFAKKGRAATEEQLNIVNNKFNNTVGLTGNTGATDLQKLNKQGGLSFGVVGANNGEYIKTTASGSNVVADLSDSAKNKLNSTVVVEGKNAAKVTSNVIQNADGSTKTVYTVDVNNVKPTAASTEKVQAKADVAGSSDKNIAKVAPKAGENFGDAGATYEVNVSRNDVKDAAREAVTVNTTNTTNNPITVTPVQDEANHNTTYQVTFDGNKAAKQIPLTYKANGQNAQTVTLDKGLNFTNGKNTTASVDAEGVVKYDVNKDLVNINSISNTTNGPKMEFGPNSINITNGPINMGDQNITNLKSGGDVVNNAANIGDVTRISKANDLHIAPTSSNRQGETTTSYAYDAASKSVTLKYNDGNGANQSGTVAKIDLSGLADQIKDGYSFSTDAKGNVVGNHAVTPVANGKTVSYAAGKNLTVAQNIDNATGEHTYTYALSNDVDLTPNGSLKIGDTILNNGGLTITGGPSVTKTGINAGNLNITNVKAGVNDTDAVNVKQLKDSRTVVTSNDKSVTVNKTENGNQVTYDLHVAPGAAQSVWNVKSTGNTTADSEAAAKTITDGKTVEMAAGKNLTVKQTSNNDGAKVEYALSDDIKVGNDGKDGKDGVDGKIGVNGKDGSAVVINGKDGSIGLNGKDGKEGLTMKGEKGADGVTRIVYEDKNNNKHEVATLDDGLRFDANSGGEKKNKLGSKVTVKGTGAKADSEYDSSNIKTSITQGADGNSEINIGLAKDLNNINTIKNGGNATFTIGGNEFKFDGGNVNMGGNNITNLKSGGDVIDNAANIGDVKRISKANDLHIAPTQSDRAGETTTSYSYDAADKSVTLKYNDGNGANQANTIAKIDLSGLADQIKDGYSFSTDAKGNVVGNHAVTAVGNGKTVSYAAGDNLTITQKIDNATGEQTYTYALSNDIKVGNDGKDGKDGVDGKIGVNGKDGSAVVINGKDGSIGLNGKDGKDGLTMKAKDGQPGVNGKDGITRIVYEDNSKNTHEVATLDDGMKYAGDDAQGADKSKVIAKKLNETMDVVGGADKSKLTDNNIGVNNVDGKLKVQLSKEVNLTPSGSLTIGDTKITDGGLVINNGPSITKGGINAGDLNITNVKAGVNDTDAVNVKQLKSAKTEVKAGDNVTVDKTIGADGQNIYTVNAKATNLGDAELNYTANGGAKQKVKLSEGLNFVDGNYTKASVDANGVVKYDVTLGKVKDGVDGKPGVDGEDGIATVKTVVDTINNSGWKGDVTGNTVGEHSATIVKPGTTVNFGAGKNLTVEQIVDKVTGNHTYNYALSDDIKVGNDGKDGKPGVDGKIGVNGKDGSAVVINGKDGSIGLNGKDGKDGLTFKGANGQDGVDGKNGTNGMTRIVYEDSNKNKHEVATTDDGLKFTGNNESVVNKNKLNSTVKVKGEGVTEEQEKTFESAAGNIAVTADGNDTLNIRLNKNIKGIDSIQTKEIHLGTPDNYTTIKKDGDRIKYGDKTFANTDDIWTIQANGTDVPANGGKVNVKGADGITVSKSANGEMTISGSGLGTMNSFNVKSSGNTTADSETAAKKITDGKTVEFSGGKNLTVKQTSNENGAKVEYALSNNVDLTNKGSVTIGDTKITDGGLVINNGPSVTKDGINAGNKQITNVEDGVNDTDAVNVRQLKAAKTNLVDGQNTKVTGDGSKANPYKVNVEGDLNKITSITNNEGDGKLEFKGDQVVNVAGDNTIKLDGKTGDITGLTNKTLDSADFATKGRAATEEQLKLVQEEAAKKSTEKVQAKADANNIAKVAPKAGDTFGAAGATYEVSVDKNDVKDAAREAVTVTGDNKAITVDVQPNATNHTTNYQVNFNGNEAAKQIPLTYKENGGNARTVMLSDGLDFSNGVNTTAHTDANGKVSFDVKGDLTNITSISNNSNGPKVSFGGDTVNITGGNLNMGGNKITNVQKGTNDTDAVNVKQLKDSRTTLTSDDHSVVLKKTESADGGLNYDLSVKGAVDPRVDQLNEEIGRVGAQGAALSALKPMQYDPLEPTQIMAGYGNYRGNSAIAVGVAHYKNESTMFHGGLSWAGGSSHMMANAGVTWKVGNRDAEAAVADRYRKGPISSAYAVQTEMAAMKAQNAGLKGEVSDLKYENEQIKAQNAGLQSEVEVLKAQMAAMMAKMGM